MGSVAIMSMGGSPGVTTMDVLLGAVWPGPARPVIVEANVAGGGLATRFGLGRNPGLVELTASAGMSAGNPDPDDLWRAAQPIAGGPPVIVAHDNGTVVANALAVGGAAVGRWLASVPGVDALIDLGQVRAGDPGLVLAEQADLALVMCSAQPERVQVASHLVASLADRCRSLGWLVVGDSKETSVDDIEAGSGVPVWAVLPVDPKGAAVARRPELVARSSAPLVKHARTLAQSIAGQMQRPSAPEAVDLADVDPEGLPSSLGSWSTPERGEQR